jgi:hypothetical protein
MELDWITEHPHRKFGKSHLFAITSHVIDQRRPQRQ